MKRLFNPGAAALAIVSMLAIAESASAHPGHGTAGFLPGVIHPLTGIDHIAAMVAVGLWATQLGKRAIWMVPTAFVVMMIMGAGLAFAGLRIPFVEQGIAASILVLGLLIVFAMRMPVAAGMALVGLFAIFHGWAHGSEMHPEASALAFGCGFVLSTIALHAVGIALGILLAKARQKVWVRLTGLSLVGCAALLFAGVL